MQSEPYPKPQKHSITQFDPATRTAICAVCGEVNVKVEKCHRTGRPRYRCAVQCQRWNWTSRRVALGLTNRDVLALIEAQGGVCGACGDELDTTAGAVTTHLDHNHETGDVRGVLCRLCNVAIGFLQDSPIRARRVAEYLEAHP